LFKRNYKKEYANYHASPLQKKNRASRNAARNALASRVGFARLAGKDVHHRNGNPKDNSPTNLAVTSKRANRSFRRTRTARKAV
tara:strand:+ start:1084 stop:1335 length:252 start_codon:yes stop_codon:yes gene_type:complete